MSMSLRKCFAVHRIFPIVNSASKVLLPPATASNFFREQQRLRHGSINVPKQEVVKEYSNVEDDVLSNEIFSKVNDQIVSKTHGRLFAVVSILQLQYKITTEDLIVVQGTWPPTVSDKIRLEKVLLVGSSDFTLIGRPLLPYDLVTVHATVIEKTFSHPYPIFKFRPRSNYMKLRFLKNELTYLRITGIHLTGKVNELTDSDGFKNRIF